MPKTYYDVLEVSIDASEEDIKSAYRNKAVKYHPDKNPGDKKAEEAFREATEAYEVLKDSEKRKKYNQEIQSKKSPPSRYKRFRRGTDLKVKIKARREDLIKGKKRLIITERKGLCPDCNGTGSVEKELETCIYCTGTGLQGFALVMGHIKRCPYCLGAGSKPKGEKCHKCKGSALTLESIKHEITLNPVTRYFKLKNLGNCCFNGKPGDLHVEIGVIENPHYKIDKLDVIGQIKISPAQAILGDELILSIFDKEIKLKIYPGTQNGVTLKVEKGGITYKDKTGNFKAKIKIITPIAISKEEKEFYEKILTIEKEIICPKILSV